MFPRSNRNIRTQAAQWNVRLQSGELSASERAGFNEWLVEPPNAREFDISRTVVDLIADLPSDQKADLERTTFAPEGKIATFMRLLAQPLWLSGVVAVVVLVVVLSEWPALLRPTVELFSHSYTSRIGEMRSITLPDGSVAYLNTDTVLKWIGAQDDRRVLLAHGEALFEVAHDSTRPFRIALDHSEVHVLGTRFDVYRKASGSVVVTVLSGTVAVEGLEEGGAHPAWQVKLSANQQVEYSPAGPAPDIRSTVAPKAVKWREGILETERETLSTVVGELSRYTTERILIADPRLNAERIGGAFSIRDVPATLARIQKLGPIVVTHQDGAFILDYRPEGSAAVQSKATGRP
jgi:transmembrane sensor